MQCSISQLLLSQHVMCLYHWNAHLTSREEDISRGDTMVKRCTSTEDDATTNHPAEAELFSPPDVEPRVVTLHSVASLGLAAMELPRVLVVEDTAMCSKVRERGLHTILHYLPYDCFAPPDQRPYADFPCIFSSN